MGIADEGLARSRPRSAIGDSALQLLVRCSTRLSVLSSELNRTGALFAGSQRLTRLRAAGHHNGARCQHSSRLSVAASGPCSSTAMPVRNVVGSTDLAVVAEPSMSLQTMLERWGFHSEAEIAVSLVPGRPDEYRISNTGFWIIKQSPRSLEILQEVLDCPLNRTST